ncbi:hypothetical protein BSKO_04857 [Bryopsis sp. KO-2023]|nr:hypothetical protein BSKO_04857 [Bryopsis sp. KO-2023]
MTTPSWAILTLCSLCFSLALSKDAPRDKKDGERWAKKLELFGSGDDPLSWDSDELRRVRDLHSKDFSDKGRYLRSNSLAEYLGLSPVDALHLPVPVNVLLVGFRGDGHMKVDLPPEEVKEWFEHMDHVIPHTRVPLSEYSCKEDGNCAGMDRAQRPKPLKSYVHLNISIQAVEVSHEVTQKIERALEAFARPMDSRYPRGPQQVDAASFETLIDGFLNDLGLLWSYTVVVMNPGSTPKGQSYGYRVGLSRQEIELLSSDTAGLRKLEKMVRSLPSTVMEPPRWSKFSRGYHPVRPYEKFGVNALMYESSQWAGHIEDWLNKFEKMTEEGKARLDGYEDTLGGLLSTRGFHGEADLAVMLKNVADNNIHRGNETAMGKLRVTEPEEGCMVDTWVGHERWIMMDLTVMGLDWGPHVGGDGIKTSRSLPLVVQHFAGGSKTRAFHEDEHETSLTKELDAELESRYDDVKAKHQEAVKQEYDRRIDGGEENGSFQVDGSIPEETWIAMELDVYEKFAIKNCRNKKVRPAVCAEVEELVDELLHEIATSDKMDFDRLHRDHAWNIFGGEEELTEEIASQESRSKDLFLAHLSAVVSKGIRHVFVPPSLAWQQDASKLKEEGVRYAKEITFVISLISDSGRKTGGWFGGKTDFDVEALKAEIRGIKMQSQSFKFYVKKLNLLDDPLLAGALSMSLRTVNLENSNTEDGRVQERMYYDSEELGNMLRRRMGSGTRSTGSDRGLTVQIFVVSVDRENPVFIDQHYVAKALEHMVLVVHNSKVRGQHPMGVTCNGHMVGQSLAAPLKASLAATLQHLGGVLPPHLGYSPSQGAITHDWMWSVGAHPFSHTSPGWKVTESQKDAVHRRYLLDALDSSVDMINTGIEILRDERPTEEAHERLVESKELIVDLLKEFSYSIELWRRMVGDAGEMEHDRAASKIPEALKSAKKFLLLAAGIKEEIHRTACMTPPRRKFGVPEEVLGGAVLLAVAIGVYRMLPRRKKKYY